MYCKCGQLGSVRGLSYEKELGYVLCNHCLRQHLNPDAVIEPEPVQIAAPAPVYKTPANLITRRLPKLIKDLLPDNFKLKEVNQSCDHCALARQHGTVVFCKCMVDRN